VKQRWDDAPPGRTSVVLRVPGRTVEVIGLRRWTLAMVQDSMAKYAPGESLASHACAAVLRYQLHFAEASAMTFLGMSGDSIERVVVSVVEPQDSARVHHRNLPPDYRTRVAAASVLLNFVDRDPALFALLGALTESDGIVKGMAATALTSFAAERPRTVPWGSAAAAPVVHALLDATSLGESLAVMQLLTLTGASPADARALLGHGGGRMLLAYLGATAPPVREQAHRLLVALRGADLGVDPAPWRAWIATL